MVQTVLDMVGLGSGVSLLTLVSGLSLLLESDLLVFGGLGGVLLEELGKGSKGVLVNGLGELTDGGRGLESQHHDSLLSLDSDVLGPSDESGEVLHGLDISSDSEVSWGLLEKRVGVVGLSSTG